MPKINLKRFFCISRSVSPLKSPKKGGKKEAKERHSSSSSATPDDGRKTSSVTPEEGRKRRPREARRGPRIRSDTVEKVEKEVEKEKEGESSVGKDETVAEEEDGKRVESSDEMSINL